MQRALHVARAFRRISAPAHRRALPGVRMLQHEVPQLPANALKDPRRPVFLNPLQVQMPVGALTSIGHRLSGIALALGVPAAAYLFALSLQDERGFSRAVELLTHAPTQVATVLLAWALAHHVLAGVRHMLSDVNVGSPLCVARVSAYAVNLGGAAIAMFVLWAQLR